jgi:hypothetical protein
MRIKCVEVENTDCLKSSQARISPALLETGYTAQIDSVHRRD